MKLLTWDEAKNILLKKKYGLGFEEIVDAISTGYLLADIEHPKRKNQKMLIVTIKNYVYVVPYISTTGFLKTFWPSRKAKKEYMEN